MHQIYPDASLVPILQRIAVGDFHFHLFASALTIDRAITLAALAAAEAAWGGYAIQTVAAAAFTLTGVSSHNGSMLASPIYFQNTSGAPVNAYGYYITDLANAVLFAAALFDGAPVSIPDGGSYPVVPVIGDFSQYAS